MIRTGERDIPAVQPYLPDGRPAPYLLTEAELAEFFRLTSKFPGQSIRRMRDVQGLRAVQVGRRVLFRLDDVLAWIERRQRENPR